MQVRETTRPFTISTDYRKLEAQDPLRRIAARTHCVKPGCNGKYRIPFIVKNSTRSNVGKAYQKVGKQYSTRSIQSNSGQCYTCGSPFIHHYMAAIPPTEHNGVPSQPPAAPSQAVQICTLPATQQITRGCPGCGSLRSNKDCTNGFCKKCCVKAATTNPQRSPCNYRAHQLRRNGFGSQQPILEPNVNTPPQNPLPVQPTLPLQLIQTQLPFSTASVPSTSAPIRNLSNALPPGWAKMRQSSLQVDTDALLHEHQLQFNKALLQQSYNLVWYSQVRWQIPFVSILIDRPTGWHRTFNHHYTTYDTVHVLRSCQNS